MTTVEDEASVLNSLVVPNTPGSAIAVSYLRVSTKEQAEKDGSDEGYSIPAQREANQRKAEQMGTTIVAEFVDAGESARRADRPELMKMMKYVATHQVNYCIVHKVDRLARNRADDVTIHLALRDAGVMLVSATENIDETPSGMLLHGIMSTIAEFYSRNLATETLKGLTQKVARGGTIGKAPLGYRNVGVRDENGREVRTVEIDPERAKLVAWAFMVYASGEWTTNQLHAELTARGLRTPATPRRPSRPIGKSSIHRMLTNPYYKGNVRYQGVTYKGTHQPLVPPEVWYQVQTVLRTHRSAADASQIHDHYLKGTVFCGQCGSRLLVCNTKNRHGNVYPYFVCAAKHSGRGECTRQAMLIEEVERLVERHYETVQISATTRQAVAERLHSQFDELMASESDALADLTKERGRLEDEQGKLLQAHYAGAIPLDLLKKEQDRISAGLETIKNRIEAHHDEYTDARNNLDDSLNLLEHAADIYARCDDANRRLCNQAFFTKIYIEEEGEVRVGYARPFDALTSREVQADALTWVENARNENEVRTPTEGGSSVKGSHLAHLG